MSHPGLLTWQFCNHRQSGSINILVRAFPVVFCGSGNNCPEDFFGNTNVRWVPDFVLWLLCIPCLCEHFYWIRELIYHLALWLSRSLLVWRMIIIKKNPTKKEYTITRYKKSKTLTIGFLSLSHYRLWSAASRNFCTGSAEAIPEHPFWWGRIEMMFSVRHQSCCYREKGWRWGDGVA